MNLRTAANVSNRPHGGLFAALFPAEQGIARAVVLHDFVESDTSYSPDQWRRECLLLMQQRLAATTLRFGRETGADIPEDVLAQLRNAEFEWTRYTHTVLTRSQTALRALDASLIRYGITKGPGIAARCVRSRERPFSDLDLIIAPQDYVPALEVLTRSGFSEADESRLPWRGLDRFCREAVNLRHPDGASIDLHHHIPPWYWTTHLDLEAMISEASSTSDPRALPCVSPAHNLIISALHIFSDHGMPGRTLMAWRDLLVLAHDADPAAVVSIARRAQLDGWLVEMLLALPPSAHPKELIELLTESSGAVKGRLRLKALSASGWGDGRIEVSLMRLPTLNGLLFLAGMAFPPPRFVRDRFPNASAPYWRWWRSGFRSATRGAPGTHAPPVTVAAE